MNEREQRLLEAARATIDDPEVLALYQQWENEDRLNVLVPYYREIWRNKLTLWHIIQEYDNEQPTV